MLVFINDFVIIIELKKIGMLFLFEYDWLAIKANLIYEVIFFLKVIFKIEI